MADEEKSKSPGNLKLLNHRSGDYDTFLRPRYDLIMVHRGHAMDATAYFTDYPEEFVPLLIDALDTFEEYDEDVGYHGPCEQVAEALGRFGLKAGASAIPLAQRLKRDPDDESRGRFLTRSPPSVPPRRMRCRYLTHFAGRRRSMRGPYAISPPGQSIRSTISSAQRRRRSWTSARRRPISIVNSPFISARPDSQRNYAGELRWQMRTMIGHLRCCASGVHL